MVSFTRYVSDERINQFRVSDFSEIGARAIRRCGARTARKRVDDRSVARLLTKAPIDSPTLPQNYPKDASVFARAGRLETKNRRRRPNHGAKILARPQADGRSCGREAMK